MRHQKMFTGLYFVSLFMLILGAFVAHSVVQAQLEDVGSDLPVAATPSGSGSGGRIPLGDQTCDQLEQTFESVAMKRMSVESAYKIKHCDQILDDPNASVADKEECTNLANRFVYWDNYGAGVRAIAVAKQCDWAS
jgi:hypothetical protein